MNEVIQGRPDLKKCIDMYPEKGKKVVFPENTQVPANSILKIESDLTEVVICRKSNMGMSIIGYLKFKGAQNLTIFIDSDGIFRARINQQNFI